MLSQNPQGEFLSPKDLATCQRVFDQVCTDESLDHACTFQRGIVNEADLLDEIRSHRDDFMKRTG